MYVVWTDPESRVGTYREFWDIDAAAEYASGFVHQFDGEEFRVIAHIEDTAADETIDTYENINPCDACYQEFLRTRRLEG